MEEGIVRVEYSGVYELGDIGHIGLGFVTRGARGPLSFRAVERNGLGTRAVAPAHGPVTEGSGGPVFVGTSIKMAMSDRESVRQDTCARGVNLH